MRETEALMLGLKLPSDIKSRRHQRSGKPPHGIADELLIALAVRFEPICIVVKSDFKQETESFRRKSIKYFFAVHIRVFAGCLLMICRNLPGFGAAVKLRLRTGFLIGRGSLHEQPHFTAFKPLTERVTEAFCIRYQSGLYLATLRLCSASVFANISAPLSGSIRQK